MAITSSGDMLYAFLQFAATPMLAPWFYQSLPCSPLSYISSFLTALMKICGIDVMASV